MVVLWETHAHLRNHNIISCGDTLQGLIGKMLSKRKLRPAGQRGRPRATSLTKADYEALAAFRYSLRTFLAFSADAAGDAGLSPRQHQALLAIKGASEQESLSVQELASRLLINHNSAVELTDRLVEGRLVKRVRDNADGRRVKIMLTAKAERLLESLSEAHLKELDAIRPALLRLLRQLR
jgi:DNA-binding MarR family transcriptional regulator